MDLIRDYALPLPTTIISEMLGVPAEDRHQFHRWSNAVISAAHSTWGLVKAVPNVLLLMRYIRNYNKTATPIKWIYKNVRHRIPPDAI